MWIVLLVVGACAVVAGLATISVGLGVAAAGALALLVAWDLMPGDE